MRWLCYVAIVINFYLLILNLTVIDSYEHAGLAGFCIILFGVYLNYTDKWIVILSWRFVNVK